MAAIVIKTFLFQAFFIPSASMEPTLEISDRVLVNKLAYRWNEPSRGDLVVFERPDGVDADDDIKDLIKRVVALPGETVTSRRGKVFIDGEPLTESYIPDGVDTSGIERQVIPDGHVFVMGDNRGDSKDSRSFGPIDQDLIIGKAFIRVWPLDHLSFL